MGISSDHILVDVIYEMVGCDYLGEIKYPAWRKEVIDAMLRINLSDYTPEQWSYALSYINGESIRFSTSAEADEYLKSMKEQ